jgi:hypothetical protein
MVATAISAPSCPSGMLVTIGAGPMPKWKKRSSMAKPAAFEPTARNAVTGMGAPVYTSGAHMWKGTLEIL